MNYSHFLTGLDRCSVAQSTPIVKRKILHNFFMDMEPGGEQVRLYQQRIQAGADLKEILRFSDCLSRQICGTIYDSGRGKEACI